eukprot:CAMPEP_0171912422 /NCGR_PEP_ID=MMETSP0993-20121228/11096_1 /TAXON_ID=483369 /ORGANISM="non described non described, Strain CCMP2098" /LENGTH=194 /DNA_ID=CAMNT_0012546235 /DNA_START=68 /DNA_END=652 /DNA_ORIENTATION=+
MRLLIWSLFALLVPASSFVPHKSQGTHLLFRRQTTSLSVMDGATVTKQSDGAVSSYTIQVNGDASGIGPFGKAIYEKILADQRQLHKVRPVPGFKPGTIPSFIMSRIKMAAVREICFETCLAALQENQIQPMDDQEDIVLSFPGHSLDGDVPVFVKSSGWRPGDAMSFTATGVRGVEASGAAVFADRGGIENRT